MEYNAEDIKLDAVIPWVNGNDKNWQNKINQHLDVKIDFKKKRNSVRFNSIGEIDFAIKSIIKYASCFKTIYLVSDTQIPNSFKALQKLSNDNGIKLELIDHKVIFEGFEKYLPCFNSRSIESLVFKIPNLSEHYVIFNDDTFIMRKVNVQDFFINGYPVIRGKWKRFYEDQFLKNLMISFLETIGLAKKKKRIGNKKVMQNSANLTGAKKYIRRYHTPMPMRKSTLEMFFKDNDLLKNNVKHRFRHDSQFMISSLSEHLEVKQNTYHFTENTQLTYFRSYKNLFIVKLKLFWFTINSNKRFMTFQSLEMPNEKTLNYILNWLTKNLE